VKGHKGCGGKAAAGMSGAPLKKMQYVLGSRDGGGILPAQQGRYS